MARSRIPPVRCLILAFAIFTNRLEAQFQWSLQSGTITSIASGSGGFVALLQAYGGKGILHSIDGRSWTSIPTSEYSLEQVAQGNGLYIIAGYRLLLRSEDGLRWSPGENPYLGGSVILLKYLNGIFVLHGADFGLWTSPDGTNWTDRGTAPGALRDLAFGNGIYVGVTEQEVLVSTNLSDWTSQRVVNNSDAGAVAFGNGIFVLLPNSGEILWSPNGSLWNSSSEIPGRAAFRDVIFADGRFALGGDDGFVAMSADGRTWERQTARRPQGSPQLSPFRKLGYLNGHWVGGGIHGEMAHSEGNGIWATTRTFPVSDISEMSVIEGKIVGLSRTKLWVSTAPQLWTAIEVPGGSNLVRMAYGGGRYVLMGADTGVLVSTNLKDWAAGQVITTNGITDMCYGDGLFVSVGPKSSVFTSVDGLSWRLRTTGTLWLRTVVFGNGTYVAAGSGVIISSRDGINWSVRSQSNVDFYSAAFGKGLFVVVGNRSGTIMTSRDGIEWKSQTRGSIHWNVAFTGSDFLVAGDSGTLLFSDDGWNWVRCYPSPYARVLSYYHGYYLGFRTDIDRPDFYTAPVDLRLLSPEAPVNEKWELRIVGLSTNRAVIERSNDFVRWQLGGEITGTDQEETRVSIPTNPFDRRTFFRVKSQNKAGPL
jgi:hypothetical protein